MEIRKKAQAIVKKMTLEEKAAQLYAVWLNIDDKGTLLMKSLSGYQQEVGGKDPFPFIKNGIGQITRPLGSQNIDPAQGVKALNRIQKFLVTETRLGIPALPHEECLSGLMAKGSTIFPCGINNGTSWDTDLVRKIGQAIGSEVHSVGSRQGLAPVLDVCRDARWGRTEETFGEDPYLTAMLGSAYVEGLQNEEYPVLATLKHYVGHSFSEGGRNHAPVRIGRRELNDVFLFPFEMAIKYAHAGSVMPAYHDIDGEPIHQSKELLNSLLRDKWGFDGIIVSDYEGIEQLVSDHRTQADKANAAAVAIHAGIDVELPGSTVYAEGIPEALKRGLLTMAEVDEAVIRHIMQKFRLGLFENPYIDEGCILKDLTEHSELARKAAESSMVLLKNNGTLPLKGTERMALIGPLADNPMGMLGGYAFPVHLIVSENRDDTSQLRTLRSCLEDVCGDSLIFAKGCDILTGRPDKPAVFPGEISMDGRLQTDYLSKDISGIEEAVNAAKAADVIVLAVGDLAGLFLSGTVGEGSDASSLALPGVQQQLIDAIIALDKPTVIAIFSGRPYHLGLGFSGAAAVIQAWLPGQEGAIAVTDIIMGKVNPGGKLPISIPRDAGAMPYYYNHKLKSAGTPIQKAFGAEFPFGHGCSYTHFEFESCGIKDSACSVDGSFEISAVIRNIGQMAGDEVVQVYARDLFAQYVRPIQELKAFKKITLAPGRACRMTFHIPADLLSYSTDAGQRIVEPGEFDILIGTSSQDIHKKIKAVITGETRILDENWRMRSEVSCEMI